MADYQDVFVERFDPTDPTRYEFRGEWRHAEIRRGTIHVRGGRPVDLVVTVTHHGPVVLGDPASGHAVSLRYSATAEPNPTFDALLPMLRASSADELEAAMRPWVDPGNNLVFADVHGAIGYRIRGDVSRPGPGERLATVPGWDGAHEWTGTIPFAEMPALRDPAAGWIATANSRIVDAAYRHYLGLDYASDFRTRRLVARLGDIHAATVADMAAIHADRSSIPARALLELASRIEPLDAGSREALAMLRRWDGAMDGGQRAGGRSTRPSGRASSATSCTRSWVPSPPTRSRACRTPLSSHVARLRGHVAGTCRSGRWRPGASAAKGDDAGSVMARRAVRRGGRRPARTLGPDPAAWAWGRLHRARPRHPL